MPSWPFEWQLNFAPAWPWPVSLLGPWTQTPLFTLPLVAGLVAMALKNYPPGFPNRRWLLGLRLAAILLALFSFLRPALVHQSKSKQSSRVLLLADQSKSMSLRDMWNDQSRWQVLTSLRAESQPDLEALGKEVKFGEYLFARDVRDVEVGDYDKPPDGARTALGDALQSLLERYPDERIAAVLVLSDGASNAGERTPAEVRRNFASRGVPVHTFGFGSETVGQQIRDIAPLSITVSPTGFKKNKLPVRAEWSMAGFANQRVPVKLQFDGVEMGTGEIRAEGEAGRGLIELSGIPETPGDVKVTLTAMPQPGELLTTNNSISTFVTIRADGLTVLHIEGKYRFWEPKFLRRALDMSPDIDLSQFFFLDTAGREGELPPDVFKPGKYDVVIVGDMPASRLSAKQQEELAAMVDAGAGLLMLGGYESFGPGGWGRTALGRLLPVEMLAADQQIDRELQFLPTPAGERHYILRLAPTPEANKAIWQKFRPLEGASGWSGLKPNALLLASAGDVPLLAAADLGRGRAAALAPQTTWRWGFSTKDAEARKRYAQFWRQMVLWLAHREDASGGGVRLRLDRRRLALGEKAPFEVEVRDKDGKVPANAKLDVTLKRPDGTEVKVTTTRVGERHVGNLPGSEVAGDFALAVSAANGAEALGAASAKFLVYDEDTEMLQLAADFDLLKQLSKETGGEFHPAAEFPAFVRSLRNKELNTEVTLPVVDRLWDRPELLALFVAVLGLEWWLRKRQGLA